MRPVQCSTNLAIKLTGDQLGAGHLMCLETFETLLKNLCEPFLPKLRSKLDWESSAKHDGEKFHKTTRCFPFCNVLGSSLPKLALYSDAYCKSYNTQGNKFGIQ